MRLKQLVLIIILIFTVILPTTISNAVPPPSATKNNKVEIQLPKPNPSTTHYQISVDGANWGNWIEIVEDPVMGTKVPVYLPVGDGKKVVFYRTGKQVDQNTPIYNILTDKIEMVKTGTRIYPNNDIKKEEFIFDIQPPSIITSTPDNLWVAKGGALMVLVEITDNLDPRPQAQIELLVGTAGVSEPTEDSDVVYKTPMKPVNENSKNLTLNLSKLNKLDNIVDPITKRKKPIHLRVTSEDASGNRSVKVETIYIKN